MTFFFKIILGESWQNVEPPLGAHLKQITVGLNVVWALDTQGKLSVRREIQPNVFPEGTYWQTLPSMLNDPIHMGKYFMHYDFKKNITFFSLL